MSHSEALDQPKRHPCNRKLQRALKLGAVLLLVAMFGVAGGFTWSVFKTLGGFHTLRTVYTSWMHPGSVAFADKTVSASGAAHPAGEQKGASPRSQPFAGRTAFEASRRLNILCLGVDYNQDRHGILYTKHVRTDSMFVVSLDRQALGLRIVSIPRDTRVEIPGHGFDKINAAFSYTAEGARALTVKTVEKFIGVHIDHTVVIKPYAAEHLIDVFGGIDVDVEKNMNYDDNWGGLHIHLKKGYQHLNGRQTVGYVRFRHDEEGDFGRIRRQQQVVNILLTQLKRIETLSRIEDLKAVFAHDIQTSLTYEQLIDLAMLYKNFDRRKMQAATIKGTDALIEDVYYLVADERQKRRIVRQLLCAGTGALLRPQPTAF